MRLTAVVPGTDRFDDLNSLAPGLQVGRPIPPAFGLTGFLRW